MKTRFLVLLCAAAMLGSLFLPWFSAPFGEDVIPFQAIRQLNSNQIERMLNNMPPEAMAFVASFALAALLLVVGLMGSTPRLLAILTGALPVGLVGWTVISSSNRASSAGINLPRGDVVEILQRASEFIGIGAWAWIGGGVVMLVLGLFDPGRRT